MDTIATADDSLVNVQWFWDGLDTFLAKNQLKQTTQRKIIVSHFLKLQKHVDAEDLYYNVRESGHNIGLATIYRTLSLLKDAGLVTQRSFADGRSVYEVLAPGLHHDHLLCVLCGKMVEFVDHEIEQLQEKVAAQNGFVLSSHRLDLFGTCSSCLAH